MSKHRTIVEDYLSKTAGGGVYDRYPDISDRDRWETIPSEYKNNLIKGFTSKYSLHLLVYFEIFENEIDAISREKQLKKLYRNVKEKLITEKNPLWKDLYLTIA